MTDHEHEGMKKCTKCGEWKPETTEYFNRDRTKKDGLLTRCNECVREYREKNRGKIAERQRKYYEKNKEKALEFKREYYEKNKEKITEWKRSNVGRLCDAVDKIRQKTGATIYVRDMTEEQKETLANQYVAVITLEKTEKELLAASGKKRCSACDRILDYGCFNKNTTKSDGVYAQCRECRAEYNREYYEKNKGKIRECYQQKKDKIKEYSREYYKKNKDREREYRQKNKDRRREYYREYRQQNKDRINEYYREYYKKQQKALDKTKSIPDNRV